MTFGDYLAVVRRRKWLILLVVAVMSAAAVALSMRQQPLYGASAEVFVSRQNPAALLSGIQDTSPLADRDAQTEADLARVPEVAARTLAAGGARGLTTDDFLTASSVSAKTNSDLLEFGVTLSDRRLASRLATTYAQQFIVYRRLLDTAALTQARTEVEHRLAQLEGANTAASAAPANDVPALDVAARSTLYANLIEKDEQFRAAEALVSSKYKLVRPADTATKVQPRPVRSGLLGLTLGLALGIGLAFFRETLDTRVRSGVEVGGELGLPLLSRVPPGSQRLKKSGGLVMLNEPHGAAAEAFRILRANLELRTFRSGAPGYALMVTSAVAGEGKSTTIANLAVGLAQAGRRVILVDLDLRRPSLSRLFGVTGRRGLVDVVYGHVPLEEALTPIAVAEQQANGVVPLSRNGGQARGSLDLLVAGAIGVEPGDFVGSSDLAATFADLRRRADLILVDAPPLLGVGDALILSGKVDGLILVSRLGEIRRPMIAELRAVLRACPAEKLGVVLSGADPRQLYGEPGYVGGYLDQARELVS